MNHGEEPDPLQVEHTAAQWYIEAVDAVADPITEARFAAWLASDASNCAAIERCETAIAIARNLKADDEVQWAFIEASEIAAKRDTPIVTTRNNRWFQNPAIAWSVAGLLAIGLAMTLADRRLPGPPKSSAAEPPPETALALSLATSQPVVVLPGHLIVDANSVAVLPFLSGDRASSLAESGLAASLHESIVERLDAVPGLYVIDRRTVGAYEGLDMLPQDIAAQLGARSIVQGRVAAADGRIKVFVRFIDATTDKPILETSYDRPAGERGAIEADIVTNIAVALATSSRRTEATRQ